MLTRTVRGGAHARPGADPPPSWQSVCEVRQRIEAQLPTLRLAVRRAEWVLRQAGHGPARSQAVTLLIEARADAAWAQRAVQRLSGARGWQDLPALRRGGPRLSP